MNCHLCNEPVDPTARTTFQRVEGWERKALSASRKSGSDIVCREPREEFAHGHCVERVRSGIPVAQGSLL